MAKLNALVQLPEGVSQKFALAILEVMPRISEKFLAKCQQAGLDDDNIIDALQLVSIYETNLPSVVNWMLVDGLSLDRIEQCLEIREEIPQLSVRTTNKIIGMINFRAEDTAPLIELLTEMADVLGGRFPLYRLVHVVEDIFGDDILAAYHLALDDQHRFLETVQGHIAWSRENDPGWEGDD